MQLYQYVQSGNLDLQCVKLIRGENFEVEIGWRINMWKVQIRRLSRKYM